MMEDHRLRLPYDPLVRADLRAVTKTTTAAGNVRFTAERTREGHADRFWALALALEAASRPQAEIAWTPAPPKAARWDQASDTAFSRGAW